MRACVLACTSSLRRSDSNFIPVQPAVPDSGRTTGTAVERVTLGAQVRQQHVVSAADAQAVPIRVCEIDLVAPRLAFDGRSELRCEGLQRPSIYVPVDDPPTRRVAAVLREVDVRRLAAQERSPASGKPRTRNSEISPVLGSRESTQVVRSGLSPESERVVEPGQDGIQRFISGRA